MFIVDSPWDINSSTETIKSWNWTCTFNRKMLKMNNSMIYPTIYE